VYPILVSDAVAIATLVAELGPVNVMSRASSPTLAELRRLGVVRVSVGSGLARVALRAVGRAAERLLAGEPTWWD
jgi:2-methylisocitrate lyase-like PEP mutase family enzyme